MARFRLPPPFNDPEDDVVFPPAHGGNFRTPAARERKPAQRANRGAIIAGVVGVVAAGALVGVMLMRRDGVIIRDTLPPGHDVRPPLSPAAQPIGSPPPSAPVLHPITVPARANATEASPTSSPSASPEPYRTTSGWGFISLSTDTPARCTILGVTVHTPVVNGSIPAGHHRAECISEDGQRRTSFDLDIRSGLSTRVEAVLDERIPWSQQHPPVRTRR